VLALVPAPAHAAGLSARDLRIDGRADQPLGVDDTAPVLSWKLSGAGTAAQQTAYEVRATDGSGTELWDSGKVASSAARATYAGAALTSRRRVSWQVRVWDAAGDASDWTGPETFEMGLLRQDAWGAAKWIAHPEEGTVNRPVTIPLGAQDARYVRLDVTKLGLPVAEGALGMVSRLQLAELQLTDSSAGDANRAAGASVSASNPYEAGGWSRAALVDGALTTPGYTSLESRTRSVSPSYWVQLDLGAVRHFDTLVLYPRTDLRTDEGQIPNFPTDFTLQTSATDPATRTTIKTVVDQPTPAGPDDQTALPVFQRGFRADKTVARARLYIAGLGEYVASVNGRPVTDTVLNPGNTNPRKSVEYGTYDVTPLLRSGENAVRIELGNGITNVYDTTNPAAGRTSVYRKFDSGAIAVTPRTIARLEVTYADGSSDAVVTDPSWSVTRGPTITDNWYAGTDYDARAVPGNDLSTWETAKVSSAPSASTKLIWREAPPVRVVDELTPVKLTQPKPGVWVFDFGQNFAGMERLHVSGLPAGTRLKLMPAELLNGDGTVNPSSTGSSNGIYDTYTTAGGDETWAPQFVYHGFQYLQVTGLPSGFTPTTAMLAGLQTRGDVEPAGSTTTTDATVNAVDRMSRYSIMSNMQSIFTDCPHREKLGWLADTIQSMGAIQRNFDMSGYLRNVIHNMAEAQLANGLVPDIAPEYPVFGGGFRDDPNWGDAMILMPRLVYETYGDTRTMRDYFPQMTAYLDYLTSKATNGILRGDLGDWVAGDGSTPPEATGTYAYYTSAKAMAEMAAALGRDADAATFSALAAGIAGAFNARFYNPVTHSYTTAGPAGTTGSQALDAFALEMEIVPQGQTEAVLNDLVARIRAYHPNGGGPHISGGTVSLQPIYRVLMRHGYDELLWETLQQPQAPSYRYFIDNGRTTIPEFWDLASSQNHMILLQIDEWFNAGLAGIGQAEGSVGFDRLVIRPRIVGDLAHVAGSYETPHGTVRSEWTRDASGVRLKVTVPAGTTARVYVPAGADETFVGVGGNADAVGREDGYQVFDVQPGDVTFLRGTSTSGTVGGTVPPTLSLNVGAPASFGAFVPGVERTYATSTTGSVTSTAGDAALSVSGPVHLANGRFVLPRPVEVTGVPRTWSGPVSNDAFAIGFRQTIDADDALRTGTYAGTLTFTLSTTAP
jgi:alpha-L-rhamnosidase